MQSASQVQDLLTGIKSKVAEEAPDLSQDLDSVLTLDEAKIRDSFAKRKAEVQS